MESMDTTRVFPTYESNVLFVLRFMVDCDVVGGNWVELPAGTYVHYGANHPRKISHCQLESHIHYSKLISHKAEGRQRAPSRVLFSCMLHEALWHPCPLWW